MSAKLSRKRILFVHDDDPKKPLSSFFEHDIRTLRRCFDVQILSVATYGHQRLDAFFSPHAWKAVASCDAVFGWFGSCSPIVIMASILHKPSIIIAGGSDVVHLPEIGYGLNPKQKLAFSILLLGYKIARKVLLFSESSKNSFLSLPGMNAEKSQTLYLGIDTERFKPALTKKAHVVTFSYISANALRRKGVLTLIDTARLTPEISYRIGGRVIDQEAYKNLLICAPQNVKILGTLEDNQIIEELQSAKIYAQLSFHEGFGMAVGEAMACGCIPLVTDRGSLPEVVGDTGVYVPVNDPAAAAQAIRKILSSDCSDMSSRARARIVNLFQPIFREHKLRIILNEVIGL